MKKVCGAKLRGKDRTCQKSPMANGRCRLHGGATPSGPANANYTHGRYADVFKGKLAEKFRQAQGDGKPLDLLPELYVQRSLLAQFIDQVTKKTTPSIIDLKRVSMLAEDVVRTAATIAKVRNETALTIAEIRFIQTGMLRLLEKYVTDTERRRNFIEELRGLLPQRVDADGGEALTAGAEASIGSA